MWVLELIRRDNMFIEYQSDGDMVQQFIWEKVGMDWGHFSGICNLTDRDLLTLQALCMAEYNKRQGEVSK